MNRLFFPLVVLSFLGGSACAQETRPDLFNCEGCEAIYEHSFDDLKWQTTIPDENEPGEPMVISGIVYQTDGSTPAPGVIVYVYHTNTNGEYAKRGDETGWARRHGYLRGWMKTDAAGRYQFRSIRPAAYSNRTSPAHIHISIKEPGRQEYWIDSYNFEGDALLTEEVLAGREQRGGSGVIALVRDEVGVWRGVRNIILES